ncbi:sigma-54 interaction domain-containing protein, partial [Gemmatimonadota bacterium]
AGTPLAEIEQEILSAALEGMVGRSRRMQEVYAVARRVAATDTTVLIYGESGTGKELLARAIHQSSRRAGGSFVPINCGAIPEALLESELFGHRKGAFTGAIRDNEGKFRAADGGTIFLDEVAELPLQMQVKILRVLQERTVDTIGADTAIEVDVRVIAATNQNLQLALEEGRFREDLYYRLSVVPVVIPPLRARQQDIPLLFDHFLRQSCRKQGRAMITVDPTVHERMLEYPWPGNVRELENLAERLVVMTDRDRIGLSDLPGTFSTPEPAAGRLVEGLLRAGTPLAEIEQEILSAALESNDWNQTRTARALGITRNTLIYRMRKYGLQRPALNKTE